MSQLRLVVEVEDFSKAVAFFCEALGLRQEEAFSEGDAHGVILDAGRATLEVINPAQKRLIDGVEAGGRASPRIRVAIEVEDTRVVTDRLIEAGATLIASPVVTPWDSLNSRLDAPAGIQITLFQELAGPADRTS